MTQLTTVLPVHSTLLAATGAPASPGLLFAGGVAVGALAVAAVALVLRLRRRRRIAVVAQAIEMLGRPEPNESRVKDIESLTMVEGGSDLEAIEGSVRRAARSLQERETTLAARLRELEAVLHSTANGFIALDQRRRVLDLNKAGAGMLGVRTPDVRGRLLAEVARHPALNRFVDAAMDHGNSIEETLALESEVPVLVNATAEPLRDANGRAVGLLVSLHDVTRLRRLESLRSDFVANVSHELRTPITAIKGYVETLLQVADEDPARIRRFLEIVQRNTVRLSHLVEDLLSLASLEQLDKDGRPPISFAEVRAEMVVDEVIEQLAPQAEARGIRLLKAIPSGGAAQSMLRADKVLVEQALANLVANAIRYGPERSTVTISFAPDATEKCGVIAVRDEGPGIPAIHLERIFERFYRVDRARTRRAGEAASGTGLGLAIVKHIAQLHGGQVDVESEVGVGSEFRLQIPLADRREEPSKPVHRAHPSAAASHPQ